MKCPKCNVTLLMTDKQGIEIDYCPECRGVWLDRGELDKIIERSAQPQSQPGYNPYGGHKDYDHKHYDDHHKYKRKNWLGELFD